jgi:hypothetical protein
MIDARQAAPVQLVHLLRGPDCRSVVGHTGSRGAARIRPVAIGDASRIGRARREFCRPAPNRLLDLDPDDLIAAGWPPDVTSPGSFTWTFEGNRARIELTDLDGNLVVFCDATSAPTADAVRLTYDQGACGGEVDVIR